MLRTQHSVHEDVGLIPGLAQWAKNLWHRLQMWPGPELLWLWCRPAAAALIRSFTWEHPYAADMAVKKEKRKGRKRKKGKKEMDSI